MGEHGWPLALVGALVLVVGCARPPKAPETVAQTADAGPAVSSRATPPLRITLQGIHQGDRTLLDVEMDLRGALPTPPEIRFRTSGNAVLDDGRPLPTLRGPAAPGREVRRLVLRGVDAPIVAYAEAQGPAFGFHVEARWPPETPDPVAPPETVAIPPVPMFGVMIDQAILLDAPADAP